MAFVRSELPTLQLPPVPPGRLALAATGSFTLSASAVAAPLPADPDCAPESLTLPAAGVSGSWADDSESTVSGHGYARFYTFTLVLQRRFPDLDGS